jgi:hypothetical protein
MRALTLALALFAAGSAAATPPAGATPTSAVPAAVAAPAAPAAGGVTLATELAEDGEGTILMAAAAVTGVGVAMVVGGAVILVPVGPVHEMFGSGPDSRWPWTRPVLAGGLIVVGAGVTAGGLLFLFGE